jgi:hypothetical protein
VIPLTVQTLAAIAADEEGAFLAAEELLRAFVRGTGENIGLVEPFASQLRSQPPAPEDANAVSGALADYIRRGEGKHMADAVFALGAKLDKAYTPLLRDKLHEHLASTLREYSVVWNLICALVDQGERIHSRRSGGPLELEVNIADARAYLKLHGVDVSW